MPASLDPRQLLRDGTLDADLAALLWLLLEARTPLVVAGSARDDAERVVDALAGFVPAAAPVVEIRPDDDFARVPDAPRLGWQAHSTHPASAAGIEAGDGVLRVRGLAAPDGVTGDRALVVVRALALGYGLLATMDGDGLDDVVAALGDPAVGAGPDERSRLGVVLVLAQGAGAPRVVAAHYVRPVAVDQGGHVLRLPPAVLVTWNAARGAWDDFSWGVIPELAGRLGMRSVELEREQARRAGMLREHGAPG